jgi:quercetin dioxygenase-like cupin family protein
VSAFEHSSEIAPQRIWEGVTSRAVHGEWMTLALIELDPGAQVPEHAHANEQIGILIEGSLAFTIAGEVGEVLPGGTWRIHGHVPHSVVAGPDGAVLAEAFSPPRAGDWEATERLEPGPARWP